MSAPVLPTLKKKKESLAGWSRKTHPRWWDIRQRPQLGPDIPPSESQRLEPRSTYPEVRRYQHPVQDSQVPECRSRDGAPLCLSHRGPHHRDLQGPQILGRGTAGSGWGPLQAGQAPWGKLVEVPKGEWWQLSTSHYVGTNSIPGCAQWRYINSGSAKKLNQSPPAFQAHSSPPPGHTIGIA